MLLCSNITFSQSKTLYNEIKNIANIDSLTYKIKHLTSNHFEQVEIVYWYCLLNVSDNKSVLFYKICSQLDISCIIVNGFYQLGKIQYRHTWNSFVINNDIYVIDLTNGMFMKNKNNPTLIAESVQLDLKKPILLNKVKLLEHESKLFYDALELYLNYFYY